MEFRMVQEYYSREDVQKALLNVAKNREIAGVFKNGSFSSRPNVLAYPQDVVTMVRSGVIEFHSSIERWSNPMGLKSDNYDDLRIGWDIILDIDCKEFEHARIATIILSKAIEKHGIKNYSVKYTGGKGFHVGIPWESVPKTIDYKSSEKLFPTVARHIGLYLKEFTREELGEAFLKKYKPEELAEKVGKPLGKILVDDNIDPFQIVDIDPILISPRHLFRMPYSINMKTGFVSLPLKAENLARFERDHAHPDLIRVREGFLDKNKPGESEILVAEAVDWWTRRQVSKRNEARRRVAFDKPVPKELFPPCIKNIDVGLPDGRKRSIFILRNFLYSLNWKRKDIENYITEWNKRNKPPLPDNTIRSQLRWQPGAMKVSSPPNCTKEGYYESFGVCDPDHICGKEKSIKNPVKYAEVSLGRGKKEKKKTRAKKTKEKKKK